MSAVAVAQAFGGHDLEHGTQRRSTEGEQFERLADKRSSGRVGLVHGDAVADEADVAEREDTGYGAGFGWHGARIPQGAREDSSSCASRNWSARLSIEG